ncbi:hypothetical protein ACFZBU_27735 [Embleya sp. NPDC008237]|uniref:hypothetical protein n=1 Tax=Embleya sp. NPDC008237 TaxID=3363978 RepID=UPI0036E7ADA4
MPIGHTVPVPLQQQPGNGYDPERTFDKCFRSSRPIAFGQAYATPTRLLRVGLVGADAPEPGVGSERQGLVIGLARREKPGPYLWHTPYTKVVPALLSGPRRAAGHPHVETSAADV